MARERSVAFLVLGVLVVATPVRLLWSHASWGWGTPFLVWGGLLAAGAMVAKAKRGRRG